MGNLDLLMNETRPSYNHSLGKGGARHLRISWDCSCRHNDSCNLLRLSDWLSIFLSIYKKFLCRQCSNLSIYKLCLVGGFWLSSWHVTYSQKSRRNPNWLHLHTSPHPATHTSKKFGLCGFRRWSNERCLLGTVNLALHQQKGMRSQPAEHMCCFLLMKLNKPYRVIACWHWVCAETKKPH